MTERAVLQSQILPPGGVVPVRVDDTDAVLWRSRSGVACAIARGCPHLDWDLADGVVEGEELVCPAHGWSIACDGRAFKRNEFGREDEKGVTDTWQVTERDGMILVEDHQPQRE